MPKPPKPDVESLLDTSTLRHLDPAREVRALPEPVFNDPKHHIKIFQGDCLEILAAIPADSVDLIFADPPYFLSNDGITCHAGRMVSVNKGEWDRSRGPDANHQFNRAWLAACQRVLKPNGSIWVSGTAHIIHSVGFAMQHVGQDDRSDLPRAQLLRQPSFILLELVQVFYR
jgi:tRNA1(Val) A37 N6-methylase TrmN6